METRVRERNVYGNNLNYPDNENAVLFALLLNKKTLDSRDLSIIEKLGYSIKIV